MPYKINIASMGAFVEISSLDDNTDLLKISNDAFTQRELLGKLAILWIVSTSLLLWGAIKEQQKVTKLTVKGNFL